MDAFADRYPFTALVLILVLFVAGAAVAYVFARLLLRNIHAAAGIEQPMTTLMLILGILSVVALIGALFTRDESAFTIAATGMGAFAGALTARSTAVQERPPAPEPEPVPQPLDEPTPEPVPEVEPIIDDDDPDGDA